MDSKAKDAAVDAALEELAKAKALVREAKRNYASVERKLADLLAADNVQAEGLAESIERLANIKKLQAERDRLQEAGDDPEKFVAAKLHALRLANGVNTTRTMTREIGALVLKRLEQGYSNSQVSLMVGCAPSTISNIKAGRYSFSDAPVGIPGRGRRL